jgi:Flp pilus assembly protein TadD
MHALFVIVLATGCPPSAGPSGDGTSGGEDPEVMFEDEQAARDADARAPAASAEVERAEGLLARGEADEARRVLEAAIAATPNDARAHLDLGLALEMLEDLPGAERAYRAAIDVDADFAEALNNLGLLLRDTERLDEAIEQLRHAVRVRTDYASGWLTLGLALEARGDVEEAIAAFGRAARFAPRDPMSRANLGLLHLRAGNRTQAAVELRRAIPLAHGNLAALQAVGSGLRMAGEAEPAARVMEEAVELAGDDATPALLSELALAQFAAGEREAAERTLGRVLSVDDRYATGHYLLGSLLAGRGAYADAIRHFERYLALDPRGAQAAGARERIEAARAALRAQ